MFTAVWLTIFSPIPAAMSSQNGNPWPQMGDLLVQQGRVTNEQLEAALAQQRDTGEPLGEILVARELISRVDLAQALATQWTWQRPQPEQAAAAEPQGVPRAAVDETTAALQARVESLEEQVSDLTKAFGVLQRYLRAQNEELATLRAAAPAEQPVS